MGDDVPKSHPRYESLMLRERIIGGFKTGAVVINGLIAHGRGEAFDYILGEKSNDYSLSACRAAAAMLLLAGRPVVSVNGNAAALVPRECVEIAQELSCPVEVNLFYRTPEREVAVEQALRDAGAISVLGVGDDASERIPNLLHARGKVSPRGIFAADVVLVPLEDGDRTQALRDMGKAVITVDLSPFSRSARTADVTIVDNIVRCYPVLLSEIRRLKGMSRDELLAIVDGFDNQRNLSDVFRFMKNRLDMVSEEMVK